MKALKNAMAANVMKAKTKFKKKNWISAGSTPFWVWQGTGSESIGIDPQ